MQFRDLNYCWLSSVFRFLQKWLNQLRQSPNVQFQFETGEMAIQNWTFFQNNWRKSSRNIWAPIKDKQKPIISATQHAFIQWKSKQKYEMNRR